jgi:hypothetical protein
MSRVDIPYEVLHFLNILLSSWPLLYLLSKHYTNQINWQLTTVLLRDSCSQKFQYNTLPWQLVMNLRSGAQANKSGTAGDSIVVHSPKMLSRSSLPTVLKTLLKPIILFGILSCLERHCLGRFNIFGILGCLGRCCLGQPNVLGILRCLGKVSHTIKFW